MRREGYLYVLLVSAFLLVGTLPSFAERPSWLNNGLQDYSNSYIEVVTARGRTASEARDNAEKLIDKNRSHATGRRVTVERDGNVFITENNTLTVKARIIDSYTERLSSREFQVSLLVQVAKNPTYTFESVAVTNKYNFSGRVFVPGMAQIHKGQTAKGALFITGEAAAIGGIIVCESMRQSYNSKVKNTNNASQVNFYMNRASNMTTARNCFIGAAGAIYIWNVIDGIVSKGKKHIVVKDAAMNITPYTDIISTGFALTLSF